MARTLSFQVGIRLALKDEITGEAQSDEALKVRQSDFMKEWQLENMSLCQESNQPMMRD